MKITIIGGAGVRVPLLTNGLLRFRSDLAVSELALWDIDRPGAELAAGICRSMIRKFGADLQVSVPASLEESLEGASFIISSIRVGGIQGRILDETLALKHGCVGQETVGPGGFALALRTIPAMLEYARQASRLAPQAWLLNFSNPVGIISQSLIEAGLGERCIGICDTPREQFLHLAEVLGVALEEGFFDYLGLNHLGWIRAVEVNGRDRMPELLEDSDKVRRAYKIPLFEEELIQRLGVFPTEYLYFYYTPERALRRTQAGTQTRGQLISKLGEKLMSAVDQAGNDPEAILAAYDGYLAERNATYFAVETGGRIDNRDVRKAREALYQSAAGYERIALDVMISVQNHRPSVIPVDVANRGAIWDFDDGDAVEVSCLVDRNGAHPLASGRLPGPVRELALQVKDFERLTVAAARAKSAESALEALLSNPLVGSRRQAEAILSEYRRAHTPHLDYLN